MTENFPELMSENKLQIQEVQRAPCEINTPPPTLPGFIIFKLKNIEYKEKLLNIARGEKFFTYRGTKIRITSDFSSKTTEAREKR